MFAKTNPALPPTATWGTLHLETTPVLKQLALAHRYLAELKGVAHSIPNQALLINTLALQEAKDSSEIENIITTQDDLYGSEPQSNSFESLAAKEVHAYVQALRLGFELIKPHGLLSNNHIKEIQAVLENNRAGFRTQKGTVLKNDKTGAVVYTPPQQGDEIDYYMSDLEQFINGSPENTLDPLIKMALIHHQFESIHPFYDGNGRTGRIINSLYLVKEGLLDIPILYHSRYINQNKDTYYALLQSVRVNHQWEPWLLFMLEGIVQASQQGIWLITEIRELMKHYKHTLRSQAPKRYSQELLNHLFAHPYTRRTFIERELGLSRPTATKYLKELVALGLLERHANSKEHLYINASLVRLLSTVRATVT
jgi:Fic family protein